jgi:hypothetical protein
LGHDTPLAFDVDALRELPQLFATRTGVVQEAALAPTSSDIDNFAQAFQGHVGGSPRRSDAGPAGMHYEHLRPLAHDDVAAKVV